MLENVLRQLIIELHLSPLSSMATDRLLTMLAEAEAKPVFRVNAECADFRGPTIVAPTCETFDSAGYDLPAYLWEPVTIEPGDTKVIRTGWTVDMPSGVEAQVRSRSGLAAKLGVTVLNSPGTVEPDYYPNDIKVILHNGGPEPFTVNHGDRIAQVVFSRFVRAANGEVKNRVREGGLGHTGV